VALREEALPRLLTIMGSGETAPTMVKVHRSVKELLGPKAYGVLLDTPYGFQRNADDLSSRAVAYFRDSVGMSMTPADFRTSDDLEGSGGSVLTSRMAEAPLLFSGPGSPTYALRQWAGTLVPGLLSEKLALGGAVTFASAAALTLGLLTIPVYEIYKVGEDPRWIDGLDLLSGLGLPAVVVPHYDNAEGGTHDTRFCYLGEERLEFLETEIPAGYFVLGVDEHTAIMFDLDSNEATGRGHITIRVNGRSAIVEAGDGGVSRVIPTDQLLELAASLAAGDAGLVGSAGVSGSGDSSAGGSLTDAEAINESGETGIGGFVVKVTGTPLLQGIRKCESDFRSAREAGDSDAMVAAALALNEELWAWVADPNQSDELDRGKTALRAMIVELGTLAASSMRDPAELFGPFVDLLVETRTLARTERRFAESDSIRDRLASFGVELHDTPEGSTWDRPANAKKTGATVAGTAVPAGAADPSRAAEAS
jgi:hypothetical protein